MLSTLSNPSFLFYFLGRMGISGWVFRDTSHLFSFPLLCLPRCLTSEYIGQPCTMSKLPETSRILLPSQGLVKSFLKPTWPTNADQDNLNIPAMDMELRLNLILATGLSPGTRTIVSKNLFGVENTDRQGCQGARGPPLSLISAEVIVVLRLAQPRS